MNRLAALAAPWAAVALIACGGGGGGEPAPVPVTATSSSSPPPPAAGGGTGGTTPGGASTCGLADFQAEMLRRVNEHRARGASCGARGSYPTAPALAWNDALTVAAAAHSHDMATRNYFSHTSPEGGSLRDRVEAAGYAWSSIAENIAAGYPSVAAVVDGWMASDGHCANIMSAGLRDIGVACVSSSSASYRSYWTMDLGRPR